MDYQNNMEQDSSGNTWLIIGVVVVAVAALWYFYGRQAPTLDAGSSAVEQTQMPALAGGDTTANIGADLSQVPDTSAALDADAAAAAADISGL